MSLHLFVVIVAGVVFTLLSAGIVYCNLHNMDIAVENNKEVLHFYDLALSPYYEGEEENWQGMELLIYLQGQKSHLSKEVRDRYIPVTIKSTIWLTLFLFWEVTKTVVTLLLMFGILFAILVFAGTPL